MIYDLDVVRVVKQVKNAEYIVEHAHKDFYHYIFILSGNGCIVVNGEAYQAKEMMLFAVSPGLRHSVYGTKNLCTIDIKFKASGYVKDICDGFRYCFDKLGNYEKMLITDILDEAILGNHNSRNIINARMLQLLMQLERYNASAEDVLRLDNEFDLSSKNIPDCQLDRIRMALSYIDSNLDKTLSVAQLAEICGYSCTHFSQIFKETVGISPKRYVNLKKVKSAKTLILSSELNITQISEILGYESIHYFSRIFKQITGYSPKVYYNLANSDIGINILGQSIQLGDDGFEFKKQKIDETISVPQISSL